MAYNHSLVNLQTDFVHMELVNIDLRDNFGMELFALLYLAHMREVMEDKLG